MIEQEHKHRLNVISGYFIDFILLYWFHLMSVSMIARNNRTIVRVKLQY